SGELEFEEFVELAAKFLIEEDEEALKAELKEAFRIYDKGGNGYITTETLKEILRELDNRLTEEELDGIIEEVDEDGSGTLDFDALEKEFNSFDTDGKGYITPETVGVILRMMGVKISEKNLQEVIAETDEDGSGQIEFEEFVELAAKFLVEEDEDALKEELREALPSHWPSDHRRYTTVHPSLSLQLGPHHSPVTTTTTNTNTTVMDLLEEEQITALEKAFNSFDTDAKGYITPETVGVILRMMGVKISEKHLQEVIAETDEDGSGQLEFEEFAELAAKFLIEEDQEALQTELKEAFRIYDREGNGYISVHTLKEILRELDSRLTEDDLDCIIEEIDEDGSGTIDFNEFMKMMNG
ncbi:hypothetical protein Pcinc_035631, partial [Petrolisthes cinctipes]